MRPIYVVTAVYEYEGSQMLRAFTTKEAANQVQAEYEAYLAARPVTDDSDETAWQAYCEAYAAWFLAAPKGFTECDYFTIDPIELEGV